MSPPAEDNERLSKHERDSNSDSRSGDSSSGELPGYEVPEVFSEEEEELDTVEIQDASRRAMQGSFLPVIAIL